MQGKNRNHYMPDFRGDALPVMGVQAKHVRGFD
jgi:hypothetical protein